MDKNTKFGVIGFGEFGKLVIDKLLPPGSQIFVNDKNKYLNLKRNIKFDDLRTVCSSNVIILAVPFDAYIDLLPKIAKLISKDTLVVDVCSVKIEPHELFKINGLFNRKNILMTHPLFGPQSSVNGVADKDIVITKQSGELSRQLITFWQSIGLKTTHLSADKHDLEMARVHALTSFVGRTLLNMDIKDSSVSTNYFIQLLSLIDVEQHHSKKLFETIQRHNPYARDIRKMFIEAATTLDKSIQ
ncbi:MAG: prephenate dehydrogenase/arogenate dehydrogenase family protein [bacterium]